MCGWGWEERVNRKNCEGSVEGTGLFRTLVSTLGFLQRPLSLLVSSLLHVNTSGFGGGAKYSGPTCQVQGRVGGLTAATEVSKKWDGGKEGSSWVTRVGGRRERKCLWLALCSSSSLPEELG